jgi:DNA-binding Lrp family transcriptional regulator
MDRGGQALTSESLRSPELLPIFRSRQQAELLADILDEPEREQSLAELTSRLGIPTASVHREVELAENAGIIQSLGGVHVPLRVVAHVAAAAEHLDHASEAIIGGTRRQHCDPKVNCASEQPRYIAVVDALVNS